MLSLLARLSSWKLYLIGGAAVFVAGTIAGGWGVYKLYHWGEVGALRNAMEAQAELHREELGILEHKHQNDLAIAASKIKVKEVIRYVEDRPECDVPVVAVGMLDDARGVPDAASRAAREASGSAELVGLPQSVEILAHADCGTRYRSVKNALDALLDWHEAARP